MCASLKAYGLDIRIMDNDSRMHSSKIVLCCAQDMRELHPDPDYYWGPGYVYMFGIADEARSSWAADLATLLPDK